MTVVHYRSLRLRNNAGIDFPLCHAGAAILDMDKTRLATTSNKDEVTCKRCRRHAAFAGQKAAPITPRGTQW